jgi:hypothetical protein
MAKDRIQKMWKEEDLDSLALSVLEEVGLESLNRDRVIQMMSNRARLPDSTLIMAVNRVVTSIDGKYVFVKDLADKPQNS